MFAPADKIPQLTERTHSMNRPMQGHTVRPELRLPFVRWSALSGKRSKTSRQPQLRRGTVRLSHKPIPRMVSHPRAYRIRARLETVERYRLGLLRALREDGIGSLEIRVAR